MPKTMSLIGGDTTPTDTSETKATPTASKMTEKTPSATAPSTTETKLEKWKPPTARQLKKIEPVAKMTTSALLSALEILSGFAPVPVSLKFSHADPESIAEVEKSVAYCIDYYGSKGTQHPLVGLGLALLGLALQSLHIEGIGKLDPLAVKAMMATPPAE